jgi:YVTN family beta-propeller protein
MKINLKNPLIATFGLLSVFLIACSKDNPITPEEKPDPVSGIYVLNEGNFQANNASVSYIDFLTNKVTLDIYGPANSSDPNKPLALGAVGSDMDIYGSLLYVVVNESNKVEILDASTAKIVKTITVPQPRFIAFHSGKAFITSYTNKVFVLDTISKAITAEIPVGKTPEQIVTSGNRLYVANAGWADGSTGGVYDNTVSVIDPVLLKEERKITVAENIDRIFADGKGKIYVNSSDIYNMVDWSIQEPSRLYRIDTKTNEVDKTYDFGAFFMVSNEDDEAYLVSNNYKAGEITFLEMGLVTGAVKETPIFSALSLSNVYAFAIDSENGDLWLSDTDYSNPGKVYRYNNKLDKVDLNYTVGALPTAFAFKR